MTPGDTARMWAIYTLYAAGMHPVRHVETCRALIRLYERLLQGDTMELPPATKYAEFMQELHDTANSNPPNESWLPFPNQGELTPGTRNTYRNRINSGELLGQEFEARTVKTFLYVRVRP